MNTVSQEYATYWQNMAKNWPGDSAGEAYFKEHYETVIREDALKKLQLIG